MLQGCEREYRQQNQDRIREKDRRHYAANRDRIIERVREWHTADPDRAAESDRRYREANLDRIRQYDREYHAANRGRRAEYGRKYRAANRDRINEQKRQHRAANRDRILERNREYWATAAHGLTREERDFIEAMQLHRCPVCLELLGDDMEIDHDHGCCSGGTSCGSCVRGVVHHGCNTIVGQFEHGRLRDSEMAELAAFYLAMTPTRMAPFHATRDTQTAA